jgi:hypothetical protein
MTLLQEEQARMRSAIEQLTKRKVRKRRYIQTEESLTVDGVRDIIAEPARSEREGSEIPAKRVRSVRRCGRCKGTGHNTRTCIVEIELDSDSEASEE